MYLANVRKETREGRQLKFDLGRKIAQKRQWQSHRGLLLPSYATDWVILLPRNATDIDILLPSYATDWVILLPSYATDWVILLLCKISELQAMQSSVIQSQL